MLELNYLKDEAIQIIGERLSKLRISSLRVDLDDEYMEKGVESLSTGISLNQHLIDVSISNIPKSIFNQIP